VVVQSSLTPRQTNISPGGVVVSGTFTLTSSNTSGTGVEYAAQVEVWDQNKTEQYGIMWEYTWIPCNNADGTPLTPTYTISNLNQAMKYQVIGTLFAWDAVHQQWDQVNTASQDFSTSGTTPWHTSDRNTSGNHGTGQWNPGVTPEPAGPIAESIPFSFKPHTFQGNSTAYSAYFTNLVHGNSGTLLGYVMWRSYFTDTTQLYTISVTPLTVDDTGAPNGSIIKWTAFAQTINDEVSTLTLKNPSPDIGNSTFTYIVQN
jgi:hypothetical protein